MLSTSFREYLKLKRELKEKLQGKLGCILEFHGFVRDYELKDGKKVRVDGLEVSHHILSEIPKIASLAKDKFDVLEVLIYHKIGYLKVGSRISSISVFASHRENAFKALEFVINEIKRFH